MEHKQHKINLFQSAKEGTLNNAPKEWVTETNLRKVDHQGFTVFAVAATYGHLNQIPAEFLTQDNLLLGRRTVFQIAAQRGHLDQIPQPLLSEENLRLPDYLKSSPLRIAARYGNFDQLQGIELSEMIIPIVGAKWWGKNKNICGKIRKEKEQALTRLSEVVDNAHDIELF